MFHSCAIWSSGKRTNVLFSARNLLCFRKIVILWKQKNRRHTKIKPVCTPIHRCIQICSYMYLHVHVCAATSQHPTNTNQLSFLQQSSETGRYYSCLQIRKLKSQGSSKLKPRKSWNWLYFLKSRVGGLCQRFTIPSFLFIVWLDFRISMQREKNHGIE